MNLNQKLDIYGFRGAFRAEARKILTEKVKQGVKLEQIQLIVEDRGTKTGVIVK